MNRLLYRPRRQIIHSDKSRLIDPASADLPIEQATDTSPNEATVKKSFSLIVFYLLFFCGLQQLFSLGLTICFIKLFSNKDPEIYEHTALGICLLINFTLIFIGMFFVPLFFVFRIRKGTKDYNEISEIVLIILTYILFAALLVGVGFCIWNIVVLINKDYTHITFTHIVLILSVGFYGTFALFIVGIIIADKIDCCTRDLC